MEIKKKWAVVCQYWLNDNDYPLVRIDAVFSDQQKAKDHARSLAQSEADMWLYKNKKYLHGETRTFDDLYETVGKPEDNIGEMSDWGFDPTDEDISDERIRVTPYKEEDMK